MSIQLSSSRNQIEAAKTLEQLRKLYLQDALGAAVEAAELPAIDAELQRFAPAESLKRLAARGIRGELIFAVPSLLTVKPNLLAYYRLVLGHSQKGFYRKLGRFKIMEEKGILREARKGELDDLCLALNQCAAELIAGVGFERITASLLDDLSLLTLGPQMRGSTNTMIGRAANRLVFELLQSIVKGHIRAVAESELQIENAAKRTIFVRFSADPDISVTEASGNTERKILAIEIKGGSDVSNIWNRLGEAEKSHLTAKRKGFPQFWTIYNVDTLNIQTAREKSPTTQHFFSLAELTKPNSEEAREFARMIIGLLGLPN